jgi:hypothetical protein
MKHHLKARLLLAASLVAASMASAQKPELICRRASNWKWSEAG